MPEGWFHTGDIGELDADGRIIITDRLKNILVLANGKNVAPAPMEIALLTSRYIAQAVILGDEQPYTGVLIAPDFDEVGQVGGAAMGWPRCRPSSSSTSAKVDEADRGRGARASSMASPSMSARDGSPSCRAC